MRDLCTERGRRLSVRCSIVMPVYGRAGLTRQCLDAVLADRPLVPFEVIVVDDASPDETRSVLASYGDAIRTVLRPENGGFANACNDGAAAADGEYLVFLNNDTVPVTGWLDELVAVADTHPKAAVIGSKLLFPNGTIQHAGVVICQDGNPRHVYAGFPADHAAVNRERALQAVTAASMLVRGDAFRRVGGFDAAFRNCLEDTDLCLRLRELGYEVRYCPASVLHHLESVSRGRRSKEIAEAGALFRERWSGKVERDDLRIYVEDGLLSIRYTGLYPLGLEVAPELATVQTSDLTRFVERQSHQVADLLRETVRLTAHVADVEVDAGEPGRRTDRVDGAGVAGLVADAERLQLDIHAFQVAVAGALSEIEAGGTPVRRPFVPGARLAYLDLKRRIAPVVEATVPPGATMVVVSRGDNSLLELEGRTGWHFPRE